MGAHDIDEPVRKGAQAMRGFARRFRPPRLTEDWMRELREGDDFKATFPSLALRVPSAGA